MFRKGETRAEEYGKIKPTAAAILAVTARGNAIFYFSLLFQAELLCNIIFKGLYLNTVLRC